MLAAPVSTLNGQRRCWNRLQSEHPFKCPQFGAGYRQVGSVPNSSLFMKSLESPSEGMGYYPIALGSGTACSKNPPGAISICALALRDPHIHSYVTSTYLNLRSQIQGSIVWADFQLRFPPEAVNRRDTMLRAPFASCSTLTGKLCRQVAQVLTLRTSSERAASSFSAFVFAESCSRCLRPRK